METLETLIIEVLLGCGPQRGVGSGGPVDAVLAASGREGPKAATLPVSHKGGWGSADARDSGESVEAAIKTENTLDAVDLHGGKVNSIARGQLLVTQNDCASALDGGTVDWKDFIDDAKQSVKGRLDCIGAVDGNVTVKDLLQDFGIGDEALAIADQILQTSPGIGFVRMGSADQIHRDV
jgi:hypothetical protein